MRYMVASMAVLSCVFFESECVGGFLGRVKKEANRAEKNVVRPVAKTMEQELRNFEKGTIRPATKNIVEAYDNHVQPELKRAEQNISEDNDRFKSWFHREAQPTVKEWYHGKFLKEIERIGRSIQDLSGRISRGETQEVDEDIRKTKEVVEELSEGIQKVRQDSADQNEENVVSKESIQKDIEIAEKKIKIAHNELENAELNKELKKDEKLSEIDRQELDFIILQKKYNVLREESELLKLKLALKEAS